MPLNDDSIPTLRNLLGRNARRHLVRRGAETPEGELSDALRAQRQAACENWAIRGLGVGAKIVDPPSIFSNIHMNAAPIIPNTLEEGDRIRATAIGDEIHRVFGRDPAFLVVTPAGRDAIEDPRYPPARRMPVVSPETWNARKADLHTQTANIFELCLEINGFKLSHNPTDYVVCMEYEGNLNQPMYPNMTHAWLMLASEFIIQTVPGANVSISCHHAGHPSNCGFIRRYVADFLPNQLQIIEGIIGDPIRATGLVTGTRSGFVADEDRSSDVHSPVAT